MWLCALVYFLDTIIVQVSSEVTVKTRLNRCVSVVFEVNTNSISGNCTSTSWKLCGGHCQLWKPWLVKINISPAGVEPVNRTCKPTFKVQWRRWRRRCTSGSTPSMHSSCSSHGCHTPAAHHCRHPQGLHQTARTPLWGSSGTYPRIPWRPCQKHCLPGRPHGLQCTGTFSDQKEGPCSNTFS